MASRQDLPLTEVHRSGDLHLVSSGDKGQLVNPATGWKGRVGGVATIQRMASVDEPWVAVPEAEWPGPVADAANSLPGSPDPSEGLA